MTFTHRLTHILFSQYPKWSTILLAHISRTILLAHISRTILLAQINGSTNLSAQINEMWNSFGSHTYTIYILV